MFILRTVFWLSVVILLLPAAKDDQTVSNANKMSMNEAVTAATSTVSDMAGFCDRNPGVCSTGKEALHTFGLKAKYGATLVYGWITGGTTTPAPTPAATAPQTPVTGLGNQADARLVIEGKSDMLQPMSASRPGTRLQSSPSQNTLTREDLAPAWKGPRPRKSA
jgi:hypothetical protein